MLLLTLVLYVPEFFLARTASQWVTAINFVFDTLLFSGTMFVISRAIEVGLADASATSLTRASLGEPVKLTTVAGALVSRREP
jgi:hypothetical protein